MSAGERGSVVLKDGRVSFMGGGDGSSISAGAEEGAVLLALRVTRSGEREEESDVRELSDDEGDDPGGEG